MRPCENRLATSLVAAVLLALCPVIGLACATPFPVESLEEGMTVEMVREAFGAPEAIESEPGNVASSWSYVHEEQLWFTTALFSSVFLPHCVIISAVTLPLGEEHWCAPFPTVEERPVVLRFEEGRLARWEVLEPVPVPVASAANTWYWQDQWHWQQQWFWSKDALHHAKGHRHHHDH